MSQTFSFARLAPARFDSSQAKRSLAALEATGAHPWLKLADRYLLEKTEVFREIMRTPGIAGCGTL
jgi:hypothetical protein